MNKTSTQSLRSLPRARRALVSMLVVLVLGLGVPRLTAQSDDFNDGIANGWTPYSLPNLPPNAPPYYLPEPGYYGAATYSFPPDDGGGLAYKIFVPAITNDPLSLMNARAGSFRASPVYSGRFSLGCDLLEWNAEWRQEAGLLFYFQDVGLGTSDGYTATYSSGYQQLYISQITDEQDTTVAELGTGAIVLNPSHRYRLVVSSHDGSTFLFQLFDKSEPTSPWVSAIGQDSAYSAGVCGLFVFQQNVPPNPQGAEAAFDNYLATAPTVGTMPATVTDLSPPPTGKVTSVYPTVTVGILDRDTSVNPNSILLSLDDVWIPTASLNIDSQVYKPNNPGAFPRDFNGATVTYAIPTLLPWGSKHTNKVAFADNLGTWQTNTWTWTIAYPFLFASNSLPVGSLTVRGFEARTVQSDNGCVNLDNTLARALQQLAIPPQIPIDRSATSIVQVLDWNKVSDPPNNVPGLCAASANPSCGTYLNIAVESFAYLELTAGLHRFHINTDDRAGLYSGANLADPSAHALWQNPGNTANSTFDFVVEAAGLYPVRCIWEETGGGAVLHLWSTNFSTGDPEVLVNDPGDPVGVVKAWYPLACQSATSVSGPYTVDSTAINVVSTVDIVGGDCSTAVVGQMVTGGKFTVPMSSTSRFYRLDGPRRTRITKTEKMGANLEITYQVQ